jgi:hypothetical protein
VSRCSSAPGELAGHADESVRILSLPIIFATIGGLFFVTIVLTYFHVPAPRWPLLSSLQPGEAFRPAVYLIVEDVTAVDGGGGLPFRQAIARRYEASQPFRRLCTEQTAIFTAWGLLFPVRAHILSSSAPAR